MLAGRRRPGAGRGAGSDGRGAWERRAELVCASRPLQYDAGSGPESIGIDAVDSLCTIEAIAPTAIKTPWARIASVSLG